MKKNDRRKKTARQRSEFWKKPFLNYPDERRKEEFIQRYKDRGNPEGFIKLVESNWEEWIREIQWIDSGCEKVCMVLDNLEDEINLMERVDYKEVLEEEI